MFFENINGWKLKIGLLGLVYFSIFRMYYGGGLYGQYKCTISIRLFF